MSSQPKKKPSSAPVTTVRPTDLKWYALICSILAFVLYANTLGHDYTVDDGTVIKNNKFTTAGIKSIPRILTSAYRAGYWDRKEGLYRPLSVAMFAVEYQLAPDQPWLGHVVNVILYMLTGWFLFFFLRKLLHKLHPVIPFIITLLYIAHPIHTEVVANIKSRDEILCFLFAILSMDLLLRWTVNHKLFTLITAAGFYFLSLMSKESAITLMAVFPLIVWFNSDKAINDLPATIFTFLSAGLLFIGIRYAVIGALAGNYELQLINNTLVGAKDFSEKFGTAMSIMGRYFLLLLFPVTMSFDYSYNTIPLLSIGSMPALLSLLAVIALIWLAVKGFQKKQWFAFGIIFFGITISLVSNILFLIEATMAERFLYMPSLGFCIAIVMGLHSWLSKKDIAKGSVIRQISSSPALVFLSLLIVIYSGRTIARNADWKDNLTLLSKDVKASPNSARIRYAYGSAILIEQALKEKDEFKKQELLHASINELEKGVSIIEDYSDAWYHLGIAYKELNDAVNSIRCFEKARSYKPFNDAEKYIAVGLAYGMAGQYDKAIAEFNQAIILDPASSEAYNNLGLYYNDAGNFEASVKSLNKALELDPQFGKAWYNMGNSYAKHGDYKIAVDYYKKALTMDGSYSDAYNNIGNCYATMSMRDSAAYYYEKAVDADPSNVKAVINVGVIYSQKGDTANARIWFEKARALGARI